MEKRTGISLHGNVDISYVKSFELHDMAVQHYHEGFEIYFQVDGNRFFFLKDKQYLLKRGDIVVLLPYELHYGASAQQTYYERYTVNFKEAYFETVLGNEGKRLMSGGSANVIVPKASCRCDDTDKRTDNTNGSVISRFVQPQKEKKCVGREDFLL